MAHKLQNLSEAQSILLQRADLHLAAAIAEAQNLDRKPEEFCCDTQRIWYKLLGRKI